MIISYQTARVLTLLVGREMFKHTQFVYDLQHNTPQYIKRGAMETEECLQIPAPTFDELLLLIPHRMGTSDSALKITKHLNCWRVFYASNTGTAQEVRMSHAIDSNNFAEILGKLWINTLVINPQLYNDEPLVKADLIRYLYPNGEYLGTFHNAHDGDLVHIGVQGGVVIETILFLASMVQNKFNQ